MEENDGWTNVDVDLPEHGQYIIGCDSKGRTWIEQWDEKEPSGDMTHWAPLSVEDYDELEAILPIRKHSVQSSRSKPYSPSHHVCSLFARIVNDVQ